MWIMRERDKARDSPHHFMSPVYNNQLVMIVRLIEPLFCKTASHRREKILWCNLVPVLKADFVFPLSFA